MQYRHRKYLQLLRTKYIVSCFSRICLCNFSLYKNISLFIWITWLYKQVFMIQSEYLHTTKSVWCAFCWMYLMFIPVTAPSHSICLGITSPDTGCSITRCWWLSQWTLERSAWDDLDHYRKTSDISRTLVGNNIVDNSDVVGAAPVGAAPTTYSFST